MTTLALNIRPGGYAVNANDQTLDLWVLKKRQEPNTPVEDGNIAFNIELIFEQESSVDNLLNHLSLIKQKMKKERMQNDKNSL